MSKRMLIDATHPEEIRVVVLSGNRLEEFDFESSTKTQLKGNIYLAKVTRVEPSLQAAFIEYGGNRHGFLSFNEIHPDYYQIPIADRPDEAEEVDDAPTDDAADTVTEETAEDGEDGDELEVVGGDEIDDERPRARPHRRYRIQEVIKRRQIMLVQVVKEERGNKGAALTTYLSLAGRYCVLMPNTARGGGISRKILDPEDRRRLKSIASELPVPEGMGVILRTAGMGRGKAEIKRDFSYLLKLWDSIRAATLESVAPALIHEEANLIKRSIRDLYRSEIEEIVVEGEAGYRMAKEFIRTLIPSHARRVKEYKDRIPLFHRYQVEGQLDAMHSPIVGLKSGGYAVFDQTEALVAIDVNSGRSTRERNIEETAYRTNLEAADEIARQLRLRDLAGLIVIDFIDMDEQRKVRAVERRFKEAMKNDRAKIQLGRISAFGLMELSRQRLRPSLIEASTLICPYCGGAGHIRSTESTALHVLRAIEEEGMRGRAIEIAVFVPSKVALYILNQKRTDLGQIEERYGFRVTVSSDDALIPPDSRIEVIKAVEGAAGKTEAAVSGEAATGEKPSRGKRRRRGGRGRKDGAGEAREREAPVEARAEDKAETPAEETIEAEGEAIETRAAGDEEPTPAKRRRRGKRGGRRRRGTATEATAEVVATDEVTADGATADVPPADVPTADVPPADVPVVEAPAVEAVAARDTDEIAPTAEVEASEDKATKTKVVEDEPTKAVTKSPAKKKPAPRRRRSRKTAPKANGEDAAPAPIGAQRPASVTAEPTAPASPAARPRPEPATASPELATVAATPPSSEQDTKQPARRGWWQKLIG